MIPGAPVAVAACPLSLGWELWQFQILEDGQKTSKRPPGPARTPPEVLYPASTQSIARSRSLSLAAIVPKPSSSHSLPPRPKAWMP